MTPGGTGIGNGEGGEVHIARADERGYSPNPVAACLTDIPNEAPLFDEI